MCSKNFKQNTAAFKVFFSRKTCSLETALFDYLIVEDDLKHWFICQRELYVTKMLPGAKLKGNY